MNNYDKFNTLIKLPSLIDEKVNYYLWRLKITKVNEQYIAIVLYDYFTSSIRISGKLYNWRNLRRNKYFINRKFIIPKGVIYPPYKLMYILHYGRLNLITFPNLPSNYL